MAKIMDEWFGSEDKITWDRTAGSLEDPLDHVSDALLMYVKGMDRMVVPRINITMACSPSDLPDADDNWTVTLTVACAPEITEGVDPSFTYEKKFTAQAATRGQATLDIANAVRKYLRSEYNRLTMQASAAEGALSHIKAMITLTNVSHDTKMEVPKGQTLDTIWSAKDPEDLESKSITVVSSPAPAISPPMNTASVWPKSDV